MRHEPYAKIRGQHAVEIASYLPPGGWYTPEDVRRAVPTLGRYRPYRALRQLWECGVLERRTSPGHYGRIEYRKKWQTGSLT